MGGDDHVERATVGMVLGGRYVVEEVVGRGGMADVYRARDRESDQTVAVKVYRPGGDADVERRFASEVRLLAPLDHPGIVAMRDGGIDGAQPFLVMPLVAGGTLADRLARGRLPVVEAVCLGQELATALEYLHGRGIVHRDVKPSNILVDEDGRALLGDFGVSRLVDAARLTTTGQLIGTAAYLAPEQVRGGEAGSAADIYALGLVLLECLTGEPVFGGTDPIAVASARLLHDPDLPAGLPCDLYATLASMTATEPERRPAARECAAQLGAAMAGPSDSAETVPLPARPVEADQGVTSPTGRMGMRGFRVRMGAVSAARVRVATLLAVAVGTAVVAVAVPFALGHRNLPSGDVLATVGVSPSASTTAPSPTPAATSRHRPTASTVATTHVSTTPDHRRAQSGDRHHRGRGHAKPHGKPGHDGGHRHAKPPGRRGPG